MSFIDPTVAIALAYAYAMLIGALVLPPMAREGMFAAFHFACLVIGVLLAKMAGRR